jgi:hypothetical protein
VLDQCIELCTDFTGHEAIELHEIFKEMFIPMQYTTINGKVFPVGKSTTRLTTDEFSAYIEKIRAFMGTEYGVTIPPHDEMPLPSETP